ncbi:MAG: DUF1570 domain-containing protein [Planctomycetia bacterium]|nr:DUF1570 domain-containing protein [Planctomycetia bacterium]
MLAPQPLVDSTLVHAAANAGWSSASELPQRSEVVAGQLVIHADFPLAGQHRLVRELDVLRTEVSQRLGLPISDEPVHLYLFESQDRYDRFASRYFPGFPVRRAFFVETDTRLAVFAPWQDRIAEDLRHETTHGYLHAVVPSVPLWLDEGIAEYFELPRSEQGRHDAHLAHLAGRLVEGTCRIDLERLESLHSAGDLSQDEYAESWCWVHWLLNTTPERKRILQDYLTDLRRDAQTAPLSARLAHLEGGVVNYNAGLRAHLENLAPR